MPNTLLYGGTFDPIHLGHLITTQRAAELLHADKVLFIPAQISPHKTTALTTPAHHRLAMLKLAIDSNPLFAADDRELHRPPPSYTFDTLASLRTDFPATTFTLLIGADQLPKLHTWHRIAELRAGPAAIHFAILGRPPLDPSAPAISMQNLPPNATLLTTPLIEISATHIRNRVAHNLSIDYLVPPKVAAYIHTHQLYRPVK